MNKNLPNINKNKISKNISAGALLNAREKALAPTSYSSRVTRNNPTAIVIMIDQSGSMNELFHLQKSKAEAVAEIVNSFLEELLDRCMKENEVRDYFEILIVGYGHKPKQGEIVSFSWEGNLKGCSWIKVSKLKENILKIDSHEEIKRLPFGEVKTTVTKKIWISPVGYGSTPMLQAFDLCHKELEKWVDNHSNSFPPMLFNITDGYPTDIDNLEEIIDITDSIKDLTTNDGNTLVFNILLKNTEGNLEPIVFPVNNEKFTNEYHETLFLASSELPQNMSKKAKDFLKNNEYSFVNPRGVMLNADVNCVVQFLNIGTSTSLDYAE